MAAVFGHHMVLQRERPLSFWGAGTPGDRVTLVWAGNGHELVAEARVDAEGAGARRQRDAGRNGDV